MFAEQIKTSNTLKNISETLLRKHDQALEEASEKSDRIRRLEEELDINSRTNYPRGDNIKERELNKKHKEITEELILLRVDLEEIWKKIDEIQTKLLEAEKK